MPADVAQLVRELHGHVAPLLHGLVMAGPCRRDRGGLEVGGRLLRAVHRLIDLSAIGEQRHETRRDVEFVQQPFGDRVALEHLVEALLADTDVADVRLRRCDHEAVPEPLPRRQLVRVGGASPREVAEFRVSRRSHGGQRLRGQASRRNPPEPSARLRAPHLLRLGPQAELPERGRV